MSDDAPFQICLFCGGNAAEPDHLSHCDGRQGQIEDEEEDEEDEPPWMAADHGAARTTDPDTSHEAAKSIKASRVEKIWLRQLDRHTELGIFGITAFEVRDETGIDSNTVTPRSATLKRKGLIKDSGERRVDPKSGRQSIVWVRTGKKETA